MSVLNTLVFINIICYLVDVNCEIYNTTEIERVSFNTSDDDPIEIQHAICRITHQEVEAAANATVTRQLKGVCSSKEMQNRINQLERTLKQEISALRTSIDTIIAKLYELKPQKNHFKRNTHSKIKSYKKTISFQDDETNDKDVYTHYFRICNIKQLISNPTNEGYVQSEQFLYDGKHLQIRIYPFYKKSQFVYIQLISNQYIQPKHRITILDKSNPYNDLTSPVLCECMVYLTTGTECKGFKISYNSLLSGNHVNEDCIDVKLHVYRYL